MKATKGIISTMFVAMLGVALSAQATNIGNTTNNTTNTTHNQGGQGGAGGTAISGAAALAGAAATGGNATGGTATIGDIRNTNTANGGSVLGSGNSNTDVRNTNTNTAAQQQGQGQAQGQQQTSNSKAQQGQAQQANNEGVRTDVTVQGGDVTYEAQKRDPVATAYSNLAAPSAPCMGSTSAGVQTVGVGVSFGSTWTSDDCNNREDIRAAFNYGDKEVAEQMIVDKIKGYASAKEKVEARRAQQAKNAPKPAQVSQLSVVPTKPVTPAAQQSRFTPEEVAAAKAALSLQ